jgi:hypothetical protein
LGYCSELKGIAAKIEFQVNQTKSFEKINFEEQFIYPYKVTMQNTGQVFAL